MNLPPENADGPTIEGFGREWSTFTQSGAEFSAQERQAIFDGYFSIFPWQSLQPDAKGADVGCGSGRWATLVAPRVGMLHAVDASPDALAVARANLAGLDNVRLHQASVSALPFADGELDFAYSLGVLHHVPDTAGAIRDVAAKLKPGAPFLIYLYYAFDNRSPLFRGIWMASNAVRVVLSRLPYALQIAATTIIAATVYWPMSCVAILLERIGAMPRSWPLSFYRRRSFYVMRTDAFDRFCTRLEQRFTRVQIAEMLAAAGFTGIKFSENEPYWVAVAIKASSP